MRKKVTQVIKSTILISFCCAFSVNAQNVYQLPNPDFELWEHGIKLDGNPTYQVNVLGKEDKSKPIEEPVGWNSFGTSIGSMRNLALATVKNWATKGNRGTSESPNYYVVLKTGAMSANGNMTTGIINANSMTPKDASNHNYTPIATEGNGVDHFRQKFNGRPDAMRVLLKYKAGGETDEFRASVSAWIHNGSDKFRDPGESNIENKAVAHAQIQPLYNEAIDWTEFEVPFDYTVSSNENNPEYILISATSNKEPGEGKQNDELNIDDLYFVYYSSITDLKIKGESIADFDESVTEYNFKGVVAPSIDDIEVVCKSKWAKVKNKSLKMAKNGNTIISIEVEGDDLSSTVYTLTYTDDAPVGLENDMNQIERVFVVEKNLHINDYIGKVEVYDLVGAKIVDQTINSNFVVNLPTGAYVVRTTNGSTTIIVK